MRGLAASQALQQLVTDVKQFISAHPDRKLVMRLFCTSGRHRSVGAATMLFYFLDVIEGRAPMLLHFHSPEWHEMQCGGQCRDCGVVDQEEVRRIMVPYLPDVRSSESVRSRIPNEPARPPQPILTPARVGAVPPRIPSDPPPPPSRREVRRAVSPDCRAEFEETLRIIEKFAMCRLIVKRQMQQDQAADLIAMRQVMD